MNPIYLFLFFISSALYSQRLIHTEVYQNGNIKNISYHKKTNNKIVKVKYEEYYENGTIYTQRSHDKGIEDEQVIFWYENGQRKEELYYKQGLQEGLHTWWYENGHVKSKGSYRNGKPDGLWIYWYNNGQKSGEGIIKNAKQDGLVTEWYENGQIAEERIYKNGRFLSKKAWSQDGSLKNK
jgi:antitoxin component YwqK of YwqJK toxin-antitoxin module